MPVRLTFRSDVRLYLVPLADVMSVVFLHRTLTPILACRSRMERYVFQRAVPEVPNIDYKNICIIYIHCLLSDMVRMAGIYTCEHQDSGYLYLIQRASAEA